MTIRPARESDLPELLATASLRRCTGHESGNKSPLPVFGPCVRSESFLPEAVPVRLYASTGYTREPVSWHHKFSFSGLQVALWGTINIHQKCSNVNVKQRGSQTVAPLLTLTHKIR